ncbi:MAG: hypothetical protein B2I18_03905 [Cuniculiplasma sp. C_DKE]|nr:MAG: hypothetical protein B2I18_03905 [Cuniculiplasma sp. C_DKE]
MIVDNNSNEKVVSSIKNYSELHNNVYLVQNGYNLGISRAYNLAAQKAEELQSDIMIFFDHDVVLEDKLFEEYRIAWNYLNRQDKNLGIIAPIVTDDVKLVGKSMFNRDKYSTIISPISSGILTPVKIFNLVGGYDPDLFVEFADYYYAYKVRKAEKNIYRINKVLILQVFEVKLKNKGFLISQADYIIRLRSIVRLGLNNSNIFRTTLSVYNSRRKIELERASVNLERKHPDTRRFLRVVRLLNKLEELSIELIEKLNKE